MTWQMAMVDANFRNQALVDSFDGPHCLAGIRVHRIRFARRLHLRRWRFGRKLLRGVRHRGLND